MPDLRQADDGYKRKLKEYADIRRHTKEHQLKVGDRVYRRKESKLLNKAEPYFESEPYEVIKVNGSMVTVQKNHQQVTRNCSFFKRIEGEGWWNIDPPNESETNDGNADDPADLLAPANNEADVPAADDPVGTPADVPAEEIYQAPRTELRRGTRIRRPPQKYVDQN